jgi:flagellar basal-body rod protein FlgB
LFDVMKARLDWLGQRQSVLARTIANADTPGYRPHDLAPFRFAHLASAASSPPLLTTHANHLAPGAADGKRAHGAEAVTRRTYEVAPAGNAVILEEQMAKVSETAIAHELTTQLYKKYTGLVRAVVSAKG